VGIFADATARALLAREPWVTDAGVGEVIVTEGDIDYLLRATWTGEADSAPAVLGLPGTSSWPTWLADRLPIGTNVYVDEHQDVNEAGRQLTARIATDLRERCRVVRVPPVAPRIGP
jgi:hypothetical protein